MYNQGMYNQGMFNSASKRKIILPTVGDTQPAKNDASVSAVYPSAPMRKRRVAMKFYLPRILVGAILVAMVPASSWAAQPIGIENTEGLSFGSFVAGSGGSVTVNTADGIRTVTGGVMLMPSSQGRPAQFTVTGQPNQTYTIQLPGNNFVKLTGPGNDMLINDFTSTPSGANGKINPQGVNGKKSQALSVGGTLDVGGGQASGSYSGSFSVTVDYN